MKKNPVILKDIEPKSVALLSATVTNTLECFLSMCEAIYRFLFMCGWFCPISLIY